MNSSNKNDSANNTPSPRDQYSKKSRWRLVMGNGCEDLCGELNEHDSLQDRCLSFLYDREGSGRNVKPAEGQGKQGGSEPSQLTVPDWINQIHGLFPKATIDRLEKDALERYQLNEMVTNPQVLKRAEPNTTLLKAVLRTKHLMNQDVLTAAKLLVRKTVEQLMEKLAKQVRSAFQGSIDRRRRSNLKIAKNFDIRSTIERNLKNYQSDSKKVIVENPYFFSRIQKKVDQWQLIILVDQSGSMLDSVIHTAVSASVFYQLKTFKMNLCVFDTEVVDLSNQIQDPVETLMKVQLGGGTDIAKAVQYGAQLVENPSKTMMVLVTDFYEGGSTGRLLSAARHLVESGVTCLGLAALDSKAEPTYDRSIAGKMVHLGWHVAAMTPGELANWVSEKLRKSS